MELFFACPVECVFEDLFECFDGDDFDFGEACRVDDDVLEVAFGYEDEFDSCFDGCFYFCGDTADREDFAANRERAGHGAVLFDGDFFECGDDCGCDSDACRVAFDSFIGLQELDVDV